MHAGGGLGVAYDAARGRYVAAYVGVLGDRLTVRTGLTPTGPWSQPREVATLPTPVPSKTFPRAVTLQSAVDVEDDASGGGVFIVSWDPVTFEPDVLSEADRGTRLGRVVLPVDLP